MFIQIQVGAIVLFKTGVGDFLDGLGGHFVDGLVGGWLESTMVLRGIGSETVSDVVLGGGRRLFLAADAYLSLVVFGILLERLGGHTATVFGGFILASVVDEVKSLVETVSFH